MLFHHNFFPEKVIKYKSFRENCVSLHRFSLNLATVSLPTHLLFGLCYDKEMSAIPSSGYWKQIEIATPLHLHQKIAIDSKFHSLLNWIATGVWMMKTLETYQPFDSPLSWILIIFNQDNHVETFGKTLPSRRNVKVKEYSGSPKGRWRELWNSRI